LIAVLGDKGPSARIEAAGALGRIKDARAVAPLITGLKDENPSVRSGAAGALISIGSPAVDPLIAVLKDEYWADRTGAAGALEMIGPPAVDLLITALKNEDWTVRTGAAGVLGKIMNDRAAEPLITALKDENLEIIAGAYSFYIQRGAPEAVAFLVKALDEYGSRISGMAEDYLNCGHDLLAKVAKEWVQKNRYSIGTLPGKRGPRWGSIPIPLNYTGQ
jgi:HEAT repeat protein